MVCARGVVQILHSQRQPIQQFEIVAAPSDCLRLFPAPAASKIVAVTAFSVGFTSVMRASQFFNSLIGESTRVPMRRGNSMAERTQREGMAS